MTKKEIFVDLKLALNDALAYERWKKIDLRATELPSPAERPFAEAVLQPGDAILLITPSTNQHYGESKYSRTSCPE